MKQLLLALALVVLFAQAASAQATFQGNFPTDTLRTTGSGMHGVAVDSRGRVWLQAFAQTDTLAFNEDVLIGTSTTPVREIPLRQIHIYNADGTEAPFSPLSALSGAVTDTLGVFFLRRDATSGLRVFDVRSGRGMRYCAAEDAVYISQFDTIFKVDAATGAGEAKVTPFPGASIVQVGVDAACNVYVTSVVPAVGRPIKIYDPSLSSELGNVAEKSSDFSRSITVSPDGLTVYETAYENTYTIRHTRPDEFSEFDSVGVAFQGMRTESAEFNPVTGQLWVSSGNPLNPPNQNPEATRTWRSNTWYAFNVSDLNTPVDSLVWNPCANFDAGGICLEIAGIGAALDTRPRGIAFSPDGLTAYAVHFNGSHRVLGGNVQKFALRPTANEPTTPQRAEVARNFPNPFRGATTIEYTLARAGQVSLVVYDLLGRQVATLVNAVQAPATHTARFDARGLATGTYVYQLRVDGQLLKSQAMVLAD